MRVRFLKNSLPYAAGEVVTFSDREARRLIDLKLAAPEPEPKAANTMAPEPVMRPAPTTVPKRRGRPPKSTYQVTE